MKTLEKQIILLRNSGIKKQVDKRLKEFSSFSNKSPESWFSELCFCILTANSKAETAINIQKELGESGFSRKCSSDISFCIRKNKHRFHNNKARYICDARKYLDIKSIIKKQKKEGGSLQAREWLVKNIKGLGFKEASHFLRNTGTTDLAILDRHILNIFAEQNIIKEKPKSMNPKIYINIEKKFLNLAEKMKMNAAELDMYLWYMKTGKVLK